MKHFEFISRRQGVYSVNDNGWILKSKINKIGYFVMVTPTQKEVTYSKGTTIRYVKHTIVGLGYISDKSTYKGIAFFDIHIRSFLVMLILSGVWYASANFYAGVGWAGLFYLLVSFLSASDDDSLLYKAKRLFEL